MPNRSNTALWVTFVLVMLVAIAAAGYRYYVSYQPDVRFVTVDITAIVEAYQTHMNVSLSDKLRDGSTAERSVAELAALNVEFGKKLKSVLEAYSNEHQVVLLNAAAVLSVPDSTMLPDRTNDIANALGLTLSR